MSEFNRETKQTFYKQCTHISNYKMSEQIYVHTAKKQMSRDSSVSITTGYGLDSWGSIPSMGKRFVSTPQHPGQHWGPSSLLPNGSQGLFHKR
jgi:hypothetical protein